MKIVYLLLAITLAGCAGVKTKSAIAPGAGLIVARTGTVCLLAGGLPDGVRYTQIGRIVATKATYGETENLMRPMADAARRIGADAIIGLQANTRFKSPLPWRVTAPTGDGEAVRLDPASIPFDCSAGGGRLL